MWNRKSIWKLFSSFSKNYENEKIINEEVYDFIEDILCKENKLIYNSSEAANNKVQDDFIEWLILRLIKQISCNKTNRLAKLMCLQKKLLVSSATNRPVLLRRSVKLYFSALNDIASKLMASLTNAQTNKNNNDMIIEGESDIYGFTMNAEDCSEYLLNAVLEILIYAASIGLEICYEVFYSETPTILKVLQIGSFKTKLKCFEYFNELLNHPDSRDLNYCTRIILTAMTATSDLEVFWLRMEAIRKNDTMEYSNLSIKLLKKIEILLTEHKVEHTRNISLAFITLLSTKLHLQSFAMQLDRTQMISLQNLISLIGNLVTLSLQKDWFAIHNLETVHPAILKYLEINQVKRHRILATFCYQEAENLSNVQLSLLNKYIIQNIMQSIRSILSITQGIDYENFKELLQAMWFLECQNLSQLHTQCILNAETIGSCISVLMKNFNNSNSNANDKESHLILLILSFMLQIETFHNLICDNSIKEILNLIETPLRQMFDHSCIVNEDNNDNYMYTLCLTSFDLLCKMQILNTDCLEKILCNWIIKIYKSSVPTQASARSIINALKEHFIENLHLLIVTNRLQRKFVFSEFLENSKQLEPLALHSILKALLCTLESDFDSESDAILLLSPLNFNQYSLEKDLYGFARYKVVCSKCDTQYKENENTEKYIKLEKKVSFSQKLQSQSSSGLMLQLPGHIKESIRAAIKRNDLNYVFLKNHLKSCCLDTADFIELLSSRENAENVSTFTSLHCQHGENKNLLFECISNVIASNVYEILHNLCNYLLLEMRKSLESAKHDSKEKRRAQQIYILNIIENVTNIESIEEKWLLYFFKLMCIFMIHPNSMVQNESLVLTKELCMAHGTHPISLWNLYKQNIQNFIVPLVILAYLQNGVRINRSIRNFSKMLGFTCVQEFIYKIYRLLLSTILPYCMEDNKCKGILWCISKITKKSIESLLISSFRRIYCHVNLYEDEGNRNKCINYTTKITKQSIKELLNINVKQTVSELLIHFNRNPQFVVDAFQYLINDGKQTISERSLQLRTDNICETKMQQFCGFICERFLGILTYFETMLRDQTMERALKIEAFCSLGQIIRFVGVAEEQVTKHRFKLTAMLDFVYSLNDPSLMEINIIVWNVFLKYINLQDLDSSLSHIVALLYPMLDKHKKEINRLYESLIIKHNKHLQRTSLQDLYFLREDKNIRSCIRHRIANETRMLTDPDTSLLDKINFFFRQISNESLNVRLHGLRHLSEFFQAHRESMNRLVLHEIRDNDMLLEKVSNVLVTSCKQADRELQLAAAKCLGELGAIDPGYMPFNNRFENLKSAEICLSVHTDNFAIMALTELCRGYQFQNDANLNDNFSLAIQETLAFCGISPKDNKKLSVWEAIPENMREVMLPLLTSCYTMSRREKACKEHPIYNSGCYRNFSEWAFLFAVRLIDYVQEENTKRLLICYKPSIKRDQLILRTFFPYILLHSLQDCSDAEMELIYEEFETVFKACRQNIVEQCEHMHDGQKEYALMLGGSINDDKMGKQIANAAAAEDIVRACIKHCSEQMSFLQRWLREWEQTNSKLLSQAGSTNKSALHYKRIKVFIEKFDKCFIARANHNSGEYARALLYLEEFVESDKQVKLQEELSFFIEIFCGLGDTDSVEGALYLKKSKLNLFENILVNQITNQNHASMICYEQLISTDDKNADGGDDDGSGRLNPQLIKGMINCYMGLETPETALLVTNGLWQKFTEHVSDDYFIEGKLEALWRLGRYDELEVSLKDSTLCQRLHHQADTKDCWSVQCAEALLLFKEWPENSNAIDLQKGLVQKLNALRLNVIQNNSSCTAVNEQNAYAQFYDDVIKLHLLTEIEKTKRLMYNMLPNLETQNLETDVREKTLLDVHLFFEEMDARLRILQPTVKVVETVLCFRRNLLGEVKRWLDVSSSHFEKNLSETLKGLLSKEIGKLWLLSQQKHKDIGNVQQAYAALMKAESYSPDTLFIEKSKLLWEKGDQTAALKLLDENITTFDLKCSSNVKALSANERSLYAEAKFLQATFNAQAKNICCELNIKYYADAISANKQSEKYYIHFAQYMEKIYERYSQQQKRSEYGCKMILDIMLSYAKSLRYGYENVYQSLPRLLSLWLDYTSEAASPDAALHPISSASSNLGSSSSASPSIFVQDTARKMNDLLNNCSSVFPAAIFYTAVSQILSRICHLSEDVFNIIRTIVIKLLENFPHQSLWLILPVLKSSYSSRVRRCKLILSDSRLADGQFQKLMVDFNMLTERLIELANTEVTLDRSYVLSGLVKQLPKLLQDPKFSRILLPFEKYMQVTFPIASCSSSWSGGIGIESGQRKSSSDLSKPTNPFPYKPVFISGINEEILVLRSAAKPKKISFQCSDGNQYAVMVKPKDDLRRDFRLMEFSGLVKRYLHLDSNARHRRLHIRTYAVIPFNEECGLVEWLPNLISFRNICVTMYRKLGLGIADKLLRQYILPNTDPIEKKRNIFKNVLLKNHPPVFHLWFRQRFTSPDAWYEARCSYVKTVAVMSIVGYILGLGDRHGENVLFDETNGEAVHVDFNCLFNQGELFAYPELVPFRLTHNMTFAMGPLCVEGLYRKCCEITLRVLKQQSETLMSVLRPFVYDLVIFNRNTDKQQHKGAELTDPKAVNDVRRINQRFQGHVRKAVSDSMPLSVEGQVNYLIGEATSIDNLAAMYIGWGSYI